MNERAVVAPTCIWCGETMTANEDLGDWLCVCGKTGDDMETARMPLPPRALVALSEDRQWLVVLEPHAVYRGGEWLQCWSLLEWEGVSFENYGFEEDNGQSAEEVLTEWMANRD